MTGSTIILTRSSPCWRPGSAVLLTVIFLTLFATLAVAFVAASDMNLQQARNHIHAQRSQMAAESGLAFLLCEMRTTYLPPTLPAEQALDVVAVRLAEKLNGTPNLGGQLVTYDGTTIRIPPIWLDAARTQSFAADVTRGAGANLQVRLRGLYGRGEKFLRMEVEPVPGASPALDYGLASKGKIILWGSSIIEGANDASEANVLGASDIQLEAVAVGGKAILAGDVWTTNPDSYVAVSGSPSIGGATGADIADHIHLGIGHVEFPQIDTDLYRPFATTVVDRSTDTSKAMTLDNIVIKAGTNPVFSSDVTLRGVVFIEQPNQVKFSGQANIIGVVVTEDPGPNSFNDNSIRFVGTSNTSGVENLPDLPQFSQIRQLKGSSILAPGFTVEFGGDFGTVNGAMAAEKFVFSGNVHGTVQGPIICYGDTEFTVTGNTHLTIDRSRYDRVPPGFLQPTILEPVPGTYTEN